MSRQRSELAEFEGALQAYAANYAVRLRKEVVARLGYYFVLLDEWNPRLHLVAPCSPAEFATRHVLESLLLLSQLPPNARVADVGSGAGLPMIPCLIARPDIQAKLIESSKKKAVFLREALKLIGKAKAAEVIAERFEDVSTLEVDFVTCRALDRFTNLFTRLVNWAPPRSTLLLFGGGSLHKEIAALHLACTSMRIPGSRERFLFVVSQTESRPALDHDLSYGL